MQILFISERFPWPLEDGGNLRTYHVLKAISQHHDVTLLSHAPKNSHDDTIRELQKICRVHTVAAPHRFKTIAGVLLRPWRWTQSLFILKNWSRPLFRESRKLLGQQKFDAVHFNHLDTAAFLNHSTWPKSVFDSHNCISAMAAQMAGKPFAGWKRFIYRRESLTLAATESAACERCDVVLACSDQDRESFLRLAPLSNVKVIPNGVDTQQFDQHARCNENTAVKSQLPRIVFTGAMDYAPNVDGVDWFCAQVLPLIRQHDPNVLLQIVGRNPGERVRRLHDLQPPIKVDSSPNFSVDEQVGVEITGRVESVLPYLNLAAVVVVPLLDGGGTRLKILEAFAAKRAVVSTTKGAEGIDAQPGSEILIADDPEAFAAAILRLLRDPTEAIRIGAAGYRLACQRYDWRTIGDQISQVYQDLETDQHDLTMPKTKFSMKKIPSTERVIG